ncbi:MULTISPECIES: hypothetical protein [Fischerella]|uniref:Uncharacterized protein n=1 Tax=Fischerella muscicola CCMEE 5323 TaxID=2019572 RepID=A0A2N6K7T1_FISMU|nr:MULTISPECIES: hypothetical protein [Fischerella]MBD2431823.1 hypothetical protein [Fischerella sp. FACHB-380]PLZ93450.1 hypothetical protein CEN44_03200 [Fischerella muscicola CCMEE 5323]
MLSREYLEKLELEELQSLAKSYGVQPIGNYVKREAWINVLANFPYKAIDQMKDGIGLHSPGMNAYFMLTTVLDMLGEPTDSQLALIRATRKDEWLVDEQWQFYQHKLNELYTIKTMLQQIVKMLAG